MYSLLFKTFHELAPKYMTDKFVFNEKCYGLRYNDKFMLRKTRTNHSYIVDPRYTMNYLLSSVS